jgi:two-component system NtrC family sensor kinase
MVPNSMDARNRPPPEDGRALETSKTTSHLVRGWRALPFSLLSFRLFLILFGAMALLLTVFTVIVHREHRGNLVTAARTSAGRAGDVIRRATRASMLRNQRGELHEIIENIGTQPGIDLVRIYNKQGSIMFSTHADEIGRAVDLQAPACIRCHAEPTPLRDLESGDHSRIFQDNDHRVLGWIGPIWNEQDCSASGCHADRQQQSVLGVLDVWMSLEHVDSQLQAGASRLRLAAGAVVLAVALSFGWLIRRLVQKPVEKLIDATEAVAQGNLQHVIAPRSTDELGVLARSFNLMTEKLRRAQTENESWAATLEERVAAKTRELRRVHAHALQMDRMASLGKLSTTVAHEINNPLSGILTYARLAERQLADASVSPDTVQSLRRTMKIISTETRRCGDIAGNLLAFARSSGSTMEPARLLELVDRSLGLVKHHLELRTVEVQRRVEGENDVIECAPGEIEQALLGLFVNSAEAMPHGGTLEVTVHLRDAEVEVSVRDTGVGIPSENQARIFEPFFTTKSDTKGVGLGLAVVYGIMQRHGGRVEVQSQVDVGSTFALLWPRVPPRNTSSEAPKDGG